MEQAFSEDQLALLRDLSAGKSLKAMAYESGRNVNSIGASLVRIYRQLGARNGPEAVAKAYQLGVLSLGHTPTYLRAKQVAALQAVIDYGSFTEAGAALGKSKQAIHQAVNRSCLILGMPLDVVITKGKREGWLK